MLGYGQETARTLFSQKRCMRHRCPKEVDYSQIHVGSGRRHVASAQPPGARAGRRTPYPGGVHADLATSRGPSQDAASHAAFGSHRYRLGARHCRAEGHRLPNLREDALARSPAPRGPKSIAGGEREPVAQTCFSRSAALPLGSPQRSIGRTAKQQAWATAIPSFVAQRDDWIDPCGAASGYITRQGRNTSQ